MMVSFQATVADLREQNGAQMRRKRHDCRSGRLTVRLGFQAETVEPQQLIVQVAVYERVLHVLLDFVVLWVQAHAITHSESHEGALHMQQGAHSALGRQSGSTSTSAASAEHALQWLTGWLGPSTHAFPRATSPCPSHHQPSDYVTPPLPLNTPTHLKEAPAHAICLPQKELIAAVAEAPQVAVMITA